jgi:hypothetical protein
MLTDSEQQYEGFRRAMSDLLHRLGVADELAAARSVGFSVEQFASISALDLFAVLDAKATALEKAAAAPVRQEGEECWDTFLTIIKAKGGAPGAIPIDGAKIRELRQQIEPTGQTQEWLAEKCNLSSASIGRAEQGACSKVTLTKLVRGLSSALKRPLSPLDLLKKPQ